MRLDGVPGSIGKSQDEVHEDLVRSVGSAPEAVLDLNFAGPPWPFLWLCPGLPGTPSNLYKALCKALKAFTSLLPGPKTTFEAFKGRLKALRLEGVPGNIVESQNEVQEDLVRSVGNAPPRMF